ncbi:hypothetical protein Tco_1309456, partial [Tanacetum coccineum]
MSHPSPKRNMVPKAILMRSGLVSLTNARPVNTAQLKTIVNKGYYCSGKNANTARPKAVVNAVRPKSVLNAVKGNQGNPQMDLQDQGVINSGCSRHMTGNMSYLTDYEEIDGGYVAFGGNPKGGKITGRVTTSRYVVPTGRVKVPSGRYVVPTSKDNVIVSAGRTKVIPAGRTILVL